MKYIYQTLSRDTKAAAESLWAMMQKEKTSESNYLNQPFTIITASDWTKLADWCYSIVDRFQFDRENVTKVRLDI